jgi:LAO/AO transport system kinase
MSVVFAAAFDIVLIETVGVGQNEVDIAAMADTTLLVIQPASGDSIQFLKAGIMEIPHLIVVNKEDLGGVAQRTFNELKSALADQPQVEGWRRSISSLSARSGKGVDQLVAELRRHFDWLNDEGGLFQQRRHQGQAYCEKSLLGEFGTFGLDKIGGRAGIRQRFETSGAAAFGHLEALRKILLG